MRLLKDRSIGTEPQVLVAWLRGRLPNDEMRAKVERLAEQLGSRSYDEREAATAALRGMGSLILPRLRSLLDDDNLEIAARARQIVGSIERGPGDGTEATMLAVLTILRDRPTPLVVEALLESMPDLPRGDVRNLASEVLWRSVTAKQRELVLRSMRNGGRLVPSSIVAFEATLDPDDSVAEIRKFLASDDEAVRLAAVRSLLHRDLPSVKRELARLLAAKDAETRERASVLARMLLLRGQLPTDEDPWQAYAENIDAGRDAWPVGEARWVVGEFDTVFAEHFVTAEPVEVLRNYGPFRVESKVPVECTIRDGVLRIPASETESDARLALDLESVLGDGPCNRLRIVAELASDGVSPVSWHPGVSVGRWKFLFHPGYSTGALRIEDVDTHEPAVGNTSMNYTPRTNVFHRMTIDLDLGASKSVRMHVQDIDRPEDEFRFGTNTFDVGEVKRVGLERSGREGGTAMFRSLVIQRPRPELDEHAPLRPGRSADATMRSTP